MDPHTARCLQLSTSIRMPPFHPYRQHRYPDSMNRSRFPVNAPAPQARPGRSNTMPASTWQAPVVTNVGFQQPCTPVSAPINGISPRNYQFPSAQNTPVQPPRLDTKCVSMGDSWDAAFQHDVKPFKHEGLGMNFLDHEHHDLTTPTMFSSVSDGFDDLVRLNESDAWDMNNPMSPDRRSLSSASSGDGISDFTDLPDMCQMPGLEMATLEEDMASSFGQTRPGRSNSRAPAPRASSSRRYRRSPYSIDHTRARSSSVMSTSSNMSGLPLSLPTTQCCSPLEEFQDDFLLNDFNGLEFSAGKPDSMLSGDIFTPTGPFESFCQPDNLIAPKPMYSCDSLFLSSPFEDQIFEATAPTVLPSSGVLNEHNHLGGNCDSHADYADEPDLFGPLSEEQSVPSEEDMKPADPDMEPTEQEVRFEGDLYTPRFVRGHGNKREGYCGLCKPGRWLVLKNSAFWYDKSFTHGISAATGLPFDAPKETRRMSGNPDVWEGLCGSCDEWIALISNKKKGTTWFRHAYKCHTHQKANDAPKKRREAVQSKSPKTKNPKQQGQGSPTASAPAQPQASTQAPGKKVPALQTITTFI